MTSGSGGEKRFEFATATRIVFGAGRLDQVGPEAKTMGSRALVVTGRSLARAGSLLELLAAQEIATVDFPVASEPTTAGTGAEVTRNSVLASPEHRVKVSLRSPLMLPRLALVDPSLTSYGMTRDDLTSVVEKSAAASSMRGNPIELTSDELWNILERAL